MAAFVPAVPTTCPSHPPPSGLTNVTALRHPPTTKARPRPLSSPGFLRGTWCTVVPAHSLALVLTGIRLQEPGSSACPCQHWRGPVHVCGVNKAGGTRPSTLTPRPPRGPSSQGGGEAAAGCPSACSELSWGVPPQQAPQPSPSPEHTQPVGPAPGAGPLWLLGAWERPSPTTRTPESHP